MILNYLIHFPSFRLADLEPVLPSINSGPEPIEGSHVEGSAVQNLY